MKFFNGLKIAAAIVSLAGLTGCVPQQTPAASPPPPPP